VDIKILVDDSSKDQTQRSPQLGVQTFVTTQLWIWRNQQTATAKLWRGRRHRGHGSSRLPYTPLLVPAMAGMIASGVYDMFWRAHSWCRRAEGRNAVYSTLRIGC